jgi:hypothetical protein
MKLHDSKMQGHMKLHDSKMHGHMKLHDSKMHGEMKLHDSKMYGHMKLKFAHNLVPHIFSGARTKDRCCRSSLSNLHVRHVVINGYWEFKITVLAHSLIP